jgi:3-hydroxyacyl-CoA dehydrogenase
MKMDIHKVVCIGSGLIGQGWATLFSSAGLEVILQDVTETVLEKAMEGVKSNLIFLEAKSLLKQGEANAALKRIKTSRLIGEAVRKQITFKSTRSL